MARKFYLKKRKQDIASSSKLAERYSQLKELSVAHVRRPFVGFSLKEDTYASLEILDSDGKPIFPLNSGAVEGGRPLARNSNFLLRAVQEQRTEKYQIVETFGLPYIFFFGERPRVYNFAGILLNTPDFPWRDEFWENYEKILRGTALVEHRARAVLSWEDIQLEGYFLSANARQNADNPNHVDFAFQLFVTDSYRLKPIRPRPFREVNWEEYVKPDIAFLSTTPPGIPKEDKAKKRQPEKLGVEVK